MATSRPSPVPPVAVTMWSQYGPYHLARLAALEGVGYDVVGFSYSSGSEKYPFFHDRPRRHELINDCPLEEVRGLTTFRRTLALLRTHHPRLVLACGYERPETAAALAYGRVRPPTRRPVVLVMVENQADDRPRRRSVEMAKGRYLRWFDGFLAGGSTHRAYLEALGVGDWPIGIGYNCVDNGRIASAASEARDRGIPLAGTKDYFLCVARMIERKNLPFLVSAYTRYRHSLPDGMKPWSLVLCGDGPDRLKVQEAVARNRVSDGVILTGAVSDPTTMANYYAFGRVAILPSLAAEPWGLVVNEAMAASLPVLVSKRCGAAYDLIDEGSNGFTFDPQDERRLAILMRWMHCNRDRLPSMGDRSAHLVQAYSPERFAKAVLRVEADALRARQHGARS